MSTRDATTTYRAAANASFQRPALQVSVGQREEEETAWVALYKASDTLFKMYFLKGLLKLVIRILSATSNLLLCYECMWGESETK